MWKCKDNSNEICVLYRYYGSSHFERIWECAIKRQADMPSAMSSQVSLQTHGPLGSQDLTVVENRAFAYRVKLKLEWIIADSASQH